SWPCSTLNCSREKLAVMLVKGKTLYLYLALDPAVARETIKGTLKDVSTKKRFQAVPTLFKVKSPLSLRKAKLLIDKMMETKQIVFKKENNSVSPQNFPAQTTEELVKAGHIKIKALDGSPIDETKTLRTAGFGIVASVTAEQAHDMITDEVASTLVQTSQNKSGARAGKKCVVNIDTLSQKFENGDVVTLDALKAKGIVGKKETAINILARGTLDKVLTVEADAFSLDAIKMIVLVGGTAIRK
ncbi:MAG: uL15 family ribosomal protein, partial [Clostridia bacterium]|nr:uL15 family ribosomal protein [Clostridia bacterium]